MYVCQRKNSLVCARSYMNSVISEGCFILLIAVKLVGKLLDGTVFTKKGHDGENEDGLFEFKTDEGMAPNTLL